jgi:hypothetical protein
MSTGTTDALMYLGTRRVSHTFTAAQLANNSQLVLTTNTCSKNLDTSNLYQYSKLSFAKLGRQSLEVKQLTSDGGGVLCSPDNMIIVPIHDRKDLN